MRKKKLNQSTKGGYYFLFAVFLLITALNTNAQGIIVRGKVVTTDSLAMPLGGVSVLIKGTRTGTTSDKDGLFELHNIDSKAKIVFSFIDFVTKEEIAEKINVTGTVSLERLNNQLADVIVTGFQRIDRKKFTGAAVELKAENIRMDGVVDVSRALEGRAAGVSVQNVSGTFGSAPKIRIRGVTSITGDNKPLWVIDGVILEDITTVANDALSSGDATTLLSSSVAGINMNDVESFFILKDAEATSLYGARAANGVVVITTKKGKAGKLQVNYNTSLSTFLKPSYSNYNVLNSAEQMSIYAEMLRKGYFNYSDVKNRSEKGVIGKMYDLTEQVDAHGSFLLQNTPEARSAFLERYARTNTDWFDILFKNAVVQEHSISLSGGTEKYRNYFSTSFFTDPGWTVADKVKRWTLNIQNTAQISPKLSVGFSTNASVRTQKAPGTENRLPDTYFGAYTRDFDINPYNYALSTSRTLAAYDEKGDLEYFTKNYAPFNVLNELKTNTLDISVVDVRLTGNLGYKILKNLTYQFTGSMRYAHTIQEHKALENSNLVGAYRAAPNAIIRQANRFLYQNPDFPNDTAQIVMPVGGIYNRSELGLKNYDVRNELNYNLTTSKHELTILLGQQFYSADRQSYSQRGYGYQYEYGGIPLVNHLQIKKDVESGILPYTYQTLSDRGSAFYLKPNYTFNKKYNLSGSVRYEGSNRLGISRNARWLPTWTVGAKWLIDQEDFMSQVGWVNDFVIRTSYGLTGSLGIAKNSTLIVKADNTSSRPKSSDIESYLYVDQLANDGLTFEKMHSLNIGTDVSLFDSRIELTADWFKKSNYDLITDFKGSGIGGQLMKTGNTGTLEGHGFEFSLKGQIIKAKNLGWTSTGVFSYFKNKMTHNKAVPIIFDLVAAEGGFKEGYPTNSLFSLNYKGLEPFVGVPGFINEKGVVSRRVYLQDPNTSYLVYEGPVNPPVTGGWDNTFRYKSLSLMVYITYQAGNSIRLNPVFRSTYTDLDAMPGEFLNRFNLPGDNLVPGIEPAIIDNLSVQRDLGGYPYNNYNFSSARVADGGFARLKTVRLTYMIPESFMAKLKMNNLSVSASMQNIALIYADKKLRGQDPEFFNAGGVAQPLQKQIVLSIRAGF